MRDWLVEAGELEGPTDNPAEDILRMLGKFEPYLQQLREAAPRPDAWFPTFWKYGKDFERPHPLLIHRASEVLYLRARCQLDLGDSAAAMREAEIILRLYQALSSERTDHSISVRHYALLNRLQDLAREGFWRNHWKEPELARLEDIIGKLDLPALFRDIIAWGRGNLNQILERAYHDQSYLSETVKPIGQDGRFYPRFWIRTNQLLLNQLLDEQISSLLSSPSEAKTPLWDATQAAQSSFYRRYRDALVLRLNMDIRGVIITTRGRFWEVQAFWAQVQVAIALERHRLAHGAFPETLSALPSPLPPDPMNGKAFGYRRTDKGYLLWSVGLNFVDNKGEPKLDLRWEVPGETRLWPVPKVLKPKRKEAP